MFLLNVIRIGINLHTTESIECVFLMVMFSVFIHIHIQVFMQSAKIFFKQNNFAFQVSLTAKLQFTVFEIYV